MEALKLIYLSSEKNYSVRDMKYNILEWNTKEGLLEIMRRFIPPIWTSIPVNYRNSFIPSGLFIPKKHIVRCRRYFMILNRMWYI